MLCLQVYLTWSSLFSSLDQLKQMNFAIIVIFVYSFYCGSLFSSCYLDQKLVYHASAPF